MQAQMAQRMKDEGLEYNSRELVCNTRRAQELSLWARSKDVSLVNALYRANFVDGKDLYDLETLVKIAADNGLDPSEARRAIEDGVMSDALDAEWRQARESGVSAVPTFAIGDNGVVGAQPYAALARLAELSGVPKRS